MKRGATEAATCELNGWTVGTRLAGDEGYGVTVIEITAIGESRILAKKVSHDGVPAEDLRYRPSEGRWTLRCRDWAEVSSCQ